jgi:glycosyltransferase involved in cell wall biosynthesis
MNTRQLSLCYTNYNRLELLVDSFKDIHDHPVIGEIVISDDCSDETIYERLKQACEFFPKVKLYRNEVNYDCYKNKRKSISLADNEFCILFDSDNKMNKDYLDRIKELPWMRTVIYAPSFARPTFDYRTFSGLTVNRRTVNEYFDRPMFSTMMNTHNFFVNRDEFLDTWDGSVDPVTADSIYFNYCWLNRGNAISVVDGLEYDHLVHEGSHYKQNNHRTGDFYQIVEAKIRAIR